MNLKYLCYFYIVFFLLVSIESYGQTKTIEIKKSVDSASGKETITTSEIITNSEDITPINNIIAINPLKFFLFYNLTYYRKINNYSVVGIGLQMPTVPEINGFGANAEYRLHLSAKSPRGFYLAPNFSFNSLTAKNEIVDGNGVKTTDEVSTSTVSAGLLCGWQWFPSDEFAMGLGIGVDYYTLLNSKSINNDNLKKYDGFFPAIRFDIGYAW
ncbi:MAG TPA: hypothetical protein PLE30_02440 [Candidatus Kapabacteria bacterium]|nr:hypothetical protein [Candidatus Kapabacteria bacterium]